MTNKQTAIYFRLSMVINRESNHSWNVGKIIPPLDTQLLDEQIGNGTRRLIKLGRLAEKPGVSENRVSSLDAAMRLTAQTLTGLREVAARRKVPFPA